MKKIPLLLMCLACVAAQASDHALSEGEGQGGQDLDGLSDGVGQPSNTVADNLFEAINDSEDQGGQGLNSLVNGQKDDACKGLDGDYEELQEASSYEDSGDETDNSIAMSLQVGSVFSQRWVEQLSKRATDGLVSYLQKFVQPAPTKKLNNPAVALAATINQSAASKDVDFILNLMAKSKKSLLIRSFQILDSNGLSIADHILMLSKKDRERVIPEMYKYYRNVLLGGAHRLHAAVTKGDAPEVIFLLTYGADIDNRYCDDYTVRELLEDKIIESVQDKNLLNVNDIRGHELARAVLRGTEENLALRLLIGTQNKIEKSKGKK